MGDVPRPLSRWAERLQLLVSGYIAESPQAQVALATAIGRDQAWVSRAASAAEVRDPTSETIALICARWPEGRLSADYFFAPGPGQVDRRAFLLRPHGLPEALQRFIASAKDMGYGVVAPEELEVLAQQRWPLGKPTPKSYADLLSALRACEPSVGGNGKHHPSDPPVSPH